MIDGPGWLAMEGEGIGIFLVKPFYKTLLNWEDTIFLCLSVWIPRARRKVCSLTSLAVRREILLAENLKKKRITYVNFVLHMQRLRRISWSFTVKLSDRRLVMIDYAEKFQNIVVNATCSCGCVVQLGIEPMGKEGKDIEM